MRWVKPKRVEIGIGAILTAMLIGAIILSRGASPPEAVALSLAPDLVLEDYDGHEIRSADWRGKYVLIHSWATWCPFCAHELSDFTALKKKFGDNLTIIAVNRAENHDMVRKYTAALGLGTSSIIFLVDPNDSLYQAIGGFAMPETLFVDNKGLIRDHARGPMDRIEMERRVSDAFGWQ